MLYGDELTVYEQQELCTLIYYPREKLSILMDENKVNDEWYRNVLNQLIQIAKLLSSIVHKIQGAKSNACGFCIYH